MANIGGIWNTDKPADGDRVSIGAKEIREHWRAIDIALNESLELPEGVFKAGAALIAVDVESNASNANDFEHHGRLLATSDTSRVFFYRTQNTLGTFGSDVSKLLGTHAYIEHNDLGAEGFRTTQSGTSLVTNGASNVNGKYAFRFQGDGIAGGTNIEFANPPLIILSCSDASYSPRLSTVTVGGFQALLVPHAGTGSSEVTLFWTSSGTRAGSI